MASSSVASSAVSCLHRQHEVFEEEGSKVVPSGKPGLFVDGPGLLASGRVADRPKIGHLLVTEPFEQQQRGLFFGGRQTPSVKLLVERRSEPVHQIPSFTSPAERLRSCRFELLAEIARFSLESSRTPKGENEATSDEGRAGQPYQENTGFGEDMGESRPFLEIQIDIYGGKNSDSEEGHEHAGEKPAFRYEVRTAEIHRILHLKDGTRSYI